MNITVTLMFYSFVFNSRATSKYLSIFSLSFSLCGPLAQSAGAVEYTDCTSAEG